VFQNQHLSSIVFRSNNQNKLLARVFAVINRGFVYQNNYLVLSYKSACCFIGTPEMAEGTAQQSYFAMCRSIFAIAINESYLFTTFFNLSENLESPIKSAVIGDNILPSPSLPILKLSSKPHLFAL